MSYANCCSLQIVSIFLCAQGKLLYFLQSASSLVGFNPDWIIHHFVESKRQYWYCLCSFVDRINFSQSQRGFIIREFYRKLNEGMIIVFDYYH